MINVAKVHCVSSPHDLLTSSPSAVETCLLNTHRFCSRYIFTGSSRWPWPYTVNSLPFSDCGELVYTLLCPLQQHGTSCHQTSGIFSCWVLSNPDSRLICLTVTDVTRHYCISRYVDNSRPCNWWWCSMLRHVGNCRFIIIIIIMFIIGMTNHDCSSKLAEKNCAYSICKTKINFRRL